MRQGISSIAAMAALFAMAACSSHGDRPARARPVFTPNGEVLTAGGKDAPKCPEALGGWWDRMVASHGGTFTREMLVADANSQFDAMDLDHDGFITPSELSDYRSALDEDGSVGIDTALPPSPPSDDTKMHQRRRGDTYVQPKIRAGQIPADVVDPVMSADKSLSFKVSREDFIAQANEDFTDFDKDHDGKLSRLELIASCPER